MQFSTSQKNSPKFWNNLNACLSFFENFVVLWLFLNKIRSRMAFFEMIRLFHMFSNSKTLQNHNFRFVLCQIGVTDQIFSGVSKTFTYSMLTVTCQWNMIVVMLPPCQEWCSNSLNDKIYVKQLYIDWLLPFENSCHSMKDASICVSKFLKHL